MLHWRMISSALITTVLAVLVAADVKFNDGAPGLWLMPLALLLTAMAVHEALALLHSEDSARAPIRWSTQLGAQLTVVGAVLPVAVRWWWGEYPKGVPLAPGEWPLLGLALGAIIAYVAELRRYKHPGGAADRVALAIFTMTYIGLMMSFLCGLRLLEVPADTTGDWGILALLSLVVVVKTSDIAAYAAGSTLGRHKMIPHLSPGKTWEGFTGGVVVACGASWLYFFLVAPLLVSDAGDAFVWWRTLAYGAVLAVCGVGGDLAVSLLKRDSGRKNSSSWLLGLGGVLDILDSVLLAAPIAWVCWKFGLVGPL